MFSLLLRNLLDDMQLKVKATDTAAATITDIIQYFNNKNS
jgi:hypothetical protein